MRELFAGFLSVSIGTSILICLAIIIRLIFRKAPKAILCCLWALIVLRLLIPFQLEAPWSARPELPVITGEDTQLLIDAEPVLEGKIPAIIPQKRVEGTSDVVVDYLGIASGLWLLGILVMGVYTFVSYLRLVFWVKEAIKKEKQVFVSANVETAFLLGYFRPKIYLPSDLPEEEAELVIAHELMHIKRGDNWLKLFGLLAVMVHWYNPLSWVVYAMLCRDIEDACDVGVICNLDADKRKIYSSALLSCGKKSRKVFGCPVAFGEISIRNRILNILNYRKPAALLSILLVVVIVLTGFFFIPDPVTQVDPPYYETLQNLLGQPLDVVCEGLGIEEESLVDLGGRTGIYDTPIQVEYQGVKFTIRLGFSIHNDLLHSFTYYAPYEGRHEEAASDIVTISNRLWENFGKGYQWYEQDDPKRLRDEKYEDILAKYTEKRAPETIAYDQWNLTHQASKSVSIWLDQIKISNLWHTHYAELSQRYGVDPHYYLEYKAIYDKDRDATVISLTYAAGWQPGHYSSMVISDYD